MKYFVSCSFGKDSIATILLALLNNEPLDGAVFAEVMFDNARGISGEIPEHIEWIKNVAKPKLEALGCPIHIVKSNTEDYVTQFNKVRQKSLDPSRIGKKQGFPFASGCPLSKACKVKPIKDFYKSLGDDVTQYIGIAADEPKRLARLKNEKNKVSLLEKYGYTEEMAKQLCEEYDLLSPIYKSNTRGGCWFCPNASYKCMANFRKSHPELWNELAELDKVPDKIGNFRYKESFSEVQLKLDKYDVE